MLLRVILVLMMILSCGALSQAAPHKMASVKKKNAYILDGVFTGGKSGEGYTILGLRRFFKAKSHRERLVLDIGDRSGRPQKGMPNFFHIELDASLNRVVMSLVQVEFETEQARSLVMKFKKSPYVKDAKMSYDATSMSTTILLTLTRKVKMEAFVLPSKKKFPSRIVVDLIGHS